MKERKTLQFSPTLCVTHDCNLNCRYCYQNHSKHERMNIDTAKACIDWIFTHIPEKYGEVTISFIGGEPLLEFRLLKEIFEYAKSKDRGIPYKFSATTNGTVLTEEMKKWFAEHSKQFRLGLSLDGTKATHDFNRNNSYDKIDFSFFLKYYSNAGVKMTLTEKSIENLADNIISIYELGFKKIVGVNLFEGDYDWSDNKYIDLLIPQLQKLVDFYLKNPDVELDQMFNKRLSRCEAPGELMKNWCGIGGGALFFDIDGYKYPCPYCTPMTFSTTELSFLCNYDFSVPGSCVDESCYRNCYIYPICPTCSGSNYKLFRDFKHRDKRRCRIQKLIALFIADLQAERIVQDPSKFEPNILPKLIKAIKKIRDLYYKEYFE